MLLPRILAPIVTPIIPPALAPIVAPLVAPTPAPSPAPSASPAPASAPAPAPAASPAPVPAAPSPVQPNPAYAGAVNAVTPRGDASRTARLQTGDATALYRATANLRVTTPAQDLLPADEPVAASDIELGILVARTQADIIANASQSLRAQARIDGQSVIDLLEA